MATNTNTDALQHRLRKLESELARQKSRNNIEGFRYEAMLLRRELIICGFVLAFLMCLFWPMR